MTAVKYDHATRIYEGTDIAAVDDLDLDIGIGQVDSSANACRAGAAERRRGLHRRP
jgi:hypothetical protein